MKQPTHGNLDWSAWYSLTILTLVHTVLYIDRTILAVLVEPIKTEFSLSDGQIGLLTGLGFSITYTLASIPLSSLADRMNRRSLLAAMVAAWSIVTLFSAWAQNYVQLVAARMGVGFAEAGANPTALSMLTDIFPENRRPSAIGVFYSATAIGTAITFIGVSAVADHLGWRAAFLLAGAPGLLLAIILRFTVAEPARTVAANESDEASIRDAFFFLARRRDLLHLMAGMIISVMVVSGFTVWIASFFMRVHGLGLQRTGLIIGLGAGVFSGLGSYLGGYFGNRLGERDRLRIGLVPIWAALCAALSAFGLSLAGNLYLALAFMLSLKLFSYMYIGPGYATVVGQLPSRIRGVGMSVVLTLCTLIGYGLGPLLVGAASDLAGGTQSLRVGVAVLGLLALWASAHFFAAWRIMAGRPSPTEITSFPPSV